jgi:hypothetical protein
MYGASTERLASAVLSARAAITAAALVLASVGLKSSGPVESLQAAATPMRTSAV